MRQYEASNIRNIAVVGHGGCGKTSLVEALLYRTGAIDRLGKSTEGTTVSDYDPEEVKRKASLNLSIVPIEYSDVKINLLDAPGLFDFALGQCEAMRAAGSALIVLSGKSGLTVGARKAYKMALKMKKPRAFFVSKMDSDHADFYKVLEQLKAEFGPSICPLVVPYVENHKVKCYIDLIGMKAYSYEGGHRAEVVMPDMGHRVEGLVNAISEAVAETDEELMDKYFSGEQFTMLELIRGIHKGIFEGTITPVFCGSATNLEGLSLLMGAMVSMLPSAAEVAKEEGISGDDIVEVECDASGADGGLRLQDHRRPLRGQAVLCEGSGRQADSRRRAHQHDHRSAGEAGQAPLCPGQEAGGDQGGPGGRHLRRQQALGQHRRHPVLAETEGGPVQGRVPDALLLHEPSCPWARAMKARFPRAWPVFWRKTPLSPIR